MSDTYNKLVAILKAEEAILDPDDAEALATIIIEQMPEIFDR